MSDRSLLKGVSHVAYDHRGIELNLTSLVFLPAGQVGVSTQRTNARWSVLLALACQEHPAHSVW